MEAYAKRYSYEVSVEIDTLSVISEYSRQEKELARKRQEMVRPKSKDEVAFEQLERALSSGTSLKDEVRVKKYEPKLIFHFNLSLGKVLNDENFWNVFESTLKNNEAQQTAWAQIHQSWKSLLLPDTLKERLAGIYASKARFILCWF